jgi:DNA-directed RNA polymerase beta subunit
MHDREKWRRRATSESVQNRCSLLKEFFRHHGWVADIPRNYLHYVGMMAELVGGTAGKPVESPDWCIESSATYEYPIVVDGHTVCTVPAMTDGGCFIIQGQEKVVPVQEVKLQSEPCVTHVFGKGTNGPCCEVLLDRASVPVRVRIADDHVIELDTHMVHRDLRGIKSIGMYEVLARIFSSDDWTAVYARIHYMLRSYRAEHADACMVYIMSSTRGAGGLSVADDREVIRSKMFGGIGNNRATATLVIMAAACAMVQLGLEPVSDRDDYSIKCMKTPGETVYRMFRHCVSMCKSAKNLKGLVDRHVYSFIKQGKMTVGGRTYSKMSMQLSRRSHVDLLSSVRKVVVPCNENSPNMKMRQIHASQRGYVCPCETPEGKTVGITKSLACCCVVSTKTDIDGWISRVCKDSMFPGCVWVVVDGAVAGWCTTEDVWALKAEHPMVSVTMPRANVAKVRTCSGRPLRPLLLVRGGPVDWRRVGQWQHMLDSGLIEYLDPAECASSTIASVGYGGDWTGFTHMELHPCAMLGLAASMIPFPEHNQSARNVFSSAMTKQAMQMHGSDKTCNYLQRPLVYTAISRAMGCDDNPNGVNLVTCMMSINGFNQEDAIIVKRSSIERGLFSSVARQSTYTVVDSPWKIVGNEGKLSVLHGGLERSLAEIAPIMSSPKVTEVKSSMMDNGRTRLDVSVKEHRRLQLGDKLSSRHAQKGVVGLIMDEIDMPFTSEGIVPDIIINPHAIPSRMTVGQLLEGVLGKASAMSGTFEDGTPFLRSGMRELENVLKMADTESVTLGTTGELVSTPIAMGIVYYMALKHQAADKVYVRSTGPKSIMSRQPISGRSKGGGLRFGEMEYDCLIAHNASRLTTEVSENSDMVDVPYCKACEAVTDLFDSPCRVCRSVTVRKRMPFSYVVLKDLMLASNIMVQTVL